MVEALFVITMYGPGCGAIGLTSSLTHPREGRTVAADPRVLPPGTPVLIQGLGPFVVEDTGDLVKGRTLDVFVESCRTARAWGDPERMVWVLGQPLSRRDWRELQAELEQLREPVRVTPASTLEAPPSGGWSRSISRALAAALGAIASWASVLVWRCVTRHGTSL